MQGEADLIYRRGQFYLHQICEVDEPPTDDVEDFLGVDLGVTNIAVDSDGTVHSARTVNNVRYRHRRLRAKLQRKGTKSAKRRLRSCRAKNNVLPKMSITRSANASWLLRKTPDAGLPSKTSRVSVTGYGCVAAREPPCTVGRFSNFASLSTTRPSGPVCP